jgi:hypothetical protein
MRVGVLGGIPDLAVTKLLRMLVVGFVCPLLMKYPAVCVLVVIAERNAPYSIGWISSLTPTFSR